MSSQYDPEGRTPLSIAVKCAREDVVYSLLMAQASPDIPDEGAYAPELFSSSFRRCTYSYSYSAVPSTFT